MRRGQPLEEENVYTRCLVFCLLSALKTEGFYVLLAAKVRRRWKEERGTEAQRKRPGQQHQPHSSSQLIRRRGLLKRLRLSCLPPTLLSLLQASSFHNSTDRCFRNALLLLCLPSSVTVVFLTENDAKRNALLTILTSSALVLIDTGPVLGVS